MSPYAFAPSVFQRASAFAPAQQNLNISHSCSFLQYATAKPNSTTTRTRLPIMASDFDDIAKQLQDEMNIRRTAAEESSNYSTPVPTSTPEEEPFEVTTGNNDMPLVILRHPESSQEAKIYRYGAAVTSWSTNGQEHFWVSDENKWQTGGKAIRGGIPICFPQFGPYGDLIQHGFARISDWQIRSTTVNDDKSVSAVFGLSSDSTQEQIAQWPHKFDAEYTVTLSLAGMETKLTVKNTDDKPFSFTFAFHNYFKTASITGTRVFGYEDVKFLDRLNGDKEMPPEEDSGVGVIVTEEIDRIYVKAPEELAVFDFSNLKVVKVKKTPTLPDATLWNPYGAEGADPGWKKFVCVEPACITNPAVVQPGESWVGAQLLGIE